MIAVAYVPPGENSRTGNPLESFVKTQNDVRNRLNRHFGRLAHVASGWIEVCRQMRGMWGELGHCPFHAD